MNKPLPPRPTPPGKPAQIAHEDRISQGTDPIVAKASASASSCTTTSGNLSAPGAFVRLSRLRELARAYEDCGCGLGPYAACVDTARAIRELIALRAEKAGSNPAPVVPQEDAGGTGTGGLTVPQGQEPWPTFGPKREGTTICRFCYWPPDQCICM